MKTRQEIIEETILNELMTPKSYGLLKNPVMNTLKSLMGIFRGGDPISGIEKQAEIEGLKTYQKEARKQSGAAMRIMSAARQPARGGEYAAMSPQGRADLLDRANQAIKRRVSGSERAQDRIIAKETEGKF